MTMLLGKEDHQHIAQAIAAAEARTTGEIYCVVARQLGAYRWVPYALGAFAALLTPLAVWLLAPDAHRWPLIGEGWSSGNLTPLDIDNAVATGLLAQGILQVVAFCLGFLIGLPLRIRLSLVPRGMRRIEAERAALQQFLAHGLQKTSRRTGVLLFVALAERQAVLIADEGINAKVGADVWAGTVSALTDAARHGRLAEGLVEAIATCGTALAAHFPAEGPSLNELPNRVVEL